MKELIIKTAGAAKDGLGPAAIGIVVTDKQGKEVFSQAEEIGNATSEYAEYFAAVRALQLLREKFGDGLNKFSHTLQSECESLIQHLSAKAEIKDVSLIGHFIEIYNLRVACFPALEPKLVKEKDNREPRQLLDKLLD
tara:strand:+ start:1541 stop:1954 length:414 start_codon:yes stop_codon:yes gene_type:complete